MGRRWESNDFDMSWESLGNGRRYGRSSCVIGACPPFMLFLTEMTTGSFTEEDHSTLIFNLYLISRNITEQMISQTRRGLLSGTALIWRKELVPIYSTDSYSNANFTVEQHLLLHSLQIGSFYMKSRLGNILDVPRWLFLELGFTNSIPTVTPGQLASSLARTSS